MPFILATGRPLIWAVGDPVIASGVTETGGLTVSGQAIQSADDENALLGALATAGVSAPPLPDAGAELRSGEVYDYNGTLLMVRGTSDHVTVRVAGDPLLQVSEFGVYQPGIEAWEWVAGELLPEGAHRTYDGQVYELYNDIGDSNWSPPPQVPAHWRVHTTETWPEWVQPTGAHDGYQEDAQVTHNGQRWINIIAAPTPNVWEPGVYGWELQP